MAKAKRQKDAKKQPGLNELPPWQIPVEDIGRLLSTMGDPRLQAIFGNDYEPLRELAKRAQYEVRARGPRVLLIHGILGSSIGKPGNFFTRDTIWFDPVSIVNGDIVKLKLDAHGNSATPFTSLDVIPTVHAYLYFRLRI